MFWALLLKIQSALTPSILGVRGSSSDSRNLSPIPFNNMPNQALKKKKEKKIFLDPKQTVRHDCQTSVVVNARLEYDQGGPIEAPLGCKKPVSVLLSLNVWTVYLDRGGSKVLAATRGAHEASHLPLSLRLSPLGAVPFRYPVINTK